MIHPSLFFISFLNQRREPNLRVEAAAVSPLPISSPPAKSPLPRRNFGVPSVGTPFSVAVTLRSTLSPSRGSHDAHRKLTPASSISHPPSSTGILGESGSREEASPPPVPVSGCPTGRSAATSDSPPRRLLLRRLRPSPSLGYSGCAAFPMESSRQPSRLHRQPIVTGQPHILRYMAAILKSCGGRDREKREDEILFTSSSMPTS